MGHRKQLENLAIMNFALMLLPPIAPLEPEDNNFESKYFNCRDCINKEEGRCLSNGLAGKFPSGKCENYEPISDFWNYNKTFGPRPEGLDVTSIPKLITLKPKLKYTEVDYNLVA
jgi:hypothetical protein